MESIKFTLARFQLRFLLSLLLHPPIPPERRIHYRKTVAVGRVTGLVLRILHPRISCFFEARRG